jgi:lipid-A-disaccharide synthase
VLSGTTVDVMIVAGEASGDMHAAALLAALKTRLPDVRAFGMGGPRLAAQGVELIHGAHEINVMGVTEVLPRIPRILKVMDDLTAAAGARKPAVAILVDIPDFNLRLAKRLKALGIQVAWYISPMVWAWRKGRVRTIAQRVDLMLCILPFEEAFYRGTGVRAHYVGSPVLEALPAPATAEHFRTALGLDPARDVLALLPGSRPGEVRRILPVLAEVGRRQLAKRSGLQLAVPVAPGLERAELSRAFDGIPVSFIDGRAPEVVGASTASVVASGTATLEAGLMQRPIIVVYKLSTPNWWIGRALLELKHISLVNLLAERGVVPELLQDDFTADAVSAHLDGLWSGPAREAQLEGLSEVRAKLGAPGASERAAALVSELVRAAGS